MTRMKLCVTCVLAAVLVATASTGRADLIHNGSFETSSFSGSFSHVALDAGLTAELADWTVGAQS